MPAVKSLSPVGAEVDVGARLGHRDLGNGADDDLVGIAPSHQLAGAPRRPHRVGGVVPQAAAGLARNALVRQHLGHAGVAAGKPVGARVARGQQLALHPHALAALLDEEVREPATVAIRQAPGRGQ